MTIFSKIASGVGWGTTSIAITTVFQLFFMAVMARLLEPADFGLIAIANVTLRFYSYFSQVGIAPALIQRKSLETGDINAALALSLGISSLFCLLAYLTSPIAEDYFNMQGLSLVMQVLAINFIILGFSSISQALLRRDSRFKENSVIEIISYVLGYGATGLIAAYMGLGVWSLVIAFMTQSILTAFLAYFVIRYPLSFKHSKYQRSAIMSYGVKYSLVGFVEFLTANIPSLVIGKLLGAAPAGFFNRAFLLAHLPVEKPANVLSKTLFPIMSSINDEHDKQLISFQLSTLLVGCYACAVSIGLYFAADDIVTVLLGSKWIEAIPVLEILSLSVAPLYIAHSAGITLDIMAKLDLKLKIQGTVFLFMIMQLLWGFSDLNLENIVYIILSTAFVRLFLMYGCVAFLLEMPKREILLMIIIMVTMVATTSAFMYLATLIEIELTIISLLMDMIAGLTGLIVGLFATRYFMQKLHSIIYLKQQLPVFKKIMEI